MLRLPRPDILVADPLADLTRVFGLPLSVEYDTRGPGNPDLISRKDVALVNRTMGARTSYSNWNRLVKQGSLRALHVIDPELDLFLSSDRQWAASRVVDNLATLFGLVVGKGIGIAIATKVLHLKRPRLIPVCDSYVLRLMGVPGQDAGSGVALVQSLRSLRSQWVQPLRHLQESLRQEGYDRTLVRIADVLMWSALDTERMRVRPPDHHPDQRRGRR